MRAPDFWGPDGHGPWPQLLAPLGRLYGAVVRRRLADSTHWKAPVPVICVGNIVAGGAGKTPVAIDLGERLVARGITVHFLSRGHGGREPGPLRVNPDRHSAEDVGDEPLLLARVAPVWVARDRAAGARAAVEAGAGAVIMDDGFQNPGLGKDLSLIVFDGGFGIGNRRLIPAGPLREPLAGGLARASAVVLLGDDRCAMAAAVAEAGGAALPLLRGRLVPDDAARRLQGRKVVAFAGIGRPQKFFDTLRDLGCDLAATHVFADHHPYRPHEIRRINRQAKRTGAVVVTTEKDALRLPATVAGDIETIAVALAWDDPAAVERLLDGVTADG